ncbi:MAG: M3 family oligoendopeptidase [Acidobacteriaceae bacterium]
MKTSNKTQIPEWDLSDFYKNTRDPRIFNDLGTSLAESKSFRKKYSGKIKPKISSALLLNMFRALEKILELAEKAAGFCELVYTTDSTDIGNAVKAQKSRELFLEIRKQLLFFDLDLARLPKQELDRLSNHPSLKNYQHYLTEIAKHKPYLLPEEQEKIFNDKSLTTAALVRLFDQHLSQKSFSIKLNGKQRQVSLEEVLNLLDDKDRLKRKAAAEALTAGLKQDRQMLSLIYNSLIKDKAISDFYRKFPSPEEERHVTNEITQAVVDSLNAAVKKHYKVVQDFYRFKAKALKLKQLEYFDRYAPVGEQQTNIKFDQAKKTVLESFAKFSPVFARIAQTFFESSWIDARPRSGKRNGAYCSGMTPNTHPVVFMNYFGTVRDVKTLAHELGHGINAFLMCKQTLLNFDHPLTLAETASVFCEMLVFDSLRNAESDPKRKFSLYMDQITNMIATVHRQISMYNFEKEVHSLQKQKGELTPDELDELWQTNQKEMHGTSVAIDQKYSNLWSYIPHFIHTPFYVYAYSFGELLTLSLYAIYKKNPDSFVPKYLKLMETGSLLSPKQQLEPFGIDLEDPKFWEQGLALMGSMIEEAKALHKSK